LHADDAIFRPRHQSELSFDDHEAWIDEQDLMLMNSCIQGILDTDFYKLSMQQAYLHQAPQAEAEWEFHCRSGEDLTPYLDLLREELEGMRDLRVSLPQLRQLSRQAPYLQADYLDFLYHFRFDPDLLQIGIEHGALKIRARGLQTRISLFEIPVLATLSELRNSVRYPEVTARHIEHSTMKKITELQRLGDSVDLGAFRFSDFGTRRRFSFAAQRQVLGLLQQHVPTQLAGTSNPLLAQHFGLPVVGTMAHEWLQTHQGLNYPLASTQKVALENWLREYHGQLGVALTDVIGIDAFCRDLDFHLASQYSGFRQDSGDPILWGEKLLARLEALDIDPAHKTLVFSDGLDFQRAVALYQHFQGRVQTSFGIGTWLMGDFGINQPMNMVMKMMRLGGQPVAKISDSPGKILCADRDYLNTLMEAFAVEASVRQQVLSQVA
jgi:nicotinate phosphoribosyltransferase